jgi:starch phosphorylase
MMKQYPESVVFLVNYDMEIGALLTRGCDVWLNNPRRPMEACGTSGMKAAMNGVLNLSILDGWWPEACEHGVNGWQISDEVVPATTEEQDKRDAASLYSVLTKSVIPTYYDDRAKWKQMMIKSIESTQDAFSADRMIREYYERLYVKG